MTTAKITVYIQALGGKYLGPNAFDTNHINLTLTLDKDKSEKIPYEYVKGKNDGNVVPIFSYKTPTSELSSFLPILGPNGSNPYVFYLTPDSTTICGKTEVNVTKPEMLGTLKATIPRPVAGPEPVPDLELTQSIALNQMQLDYRVIMTVPGLLLEHPPKDQVPKGVTALFLWVKMMCGCPITTNEEKPYWVDNDFDVSAEIFYKNRDRVPGELTFYSNKYPSLFAVLADESEVEKVNFTAKQKSTGNIGFLTVTY